MRTLRIALTGLLTVAALAVGPVATATARAADDTKCRDVSAVATGQGAFQPDGSIRTTGTVTKDPLLRGTLEGRFLLIGAPSPDLPFAGDITVTTKKGTVTVQVSGSLTTTGAFETSGQVSSGTGVFAGATGDLVIEGSQDQSGTFTETIEGQICLVK